jgi:hypothetical protein
MKTVFKTIAIATVLSALTIFNAQAQTNVTFQVNLDYELSNGVFNPEEHKVELSGNVYPLSQTRYIQLQPTESDSTIYFADVEFPPSSLNRVVTYRFRLNLGGRFMNEDLPRNLTIPNRSISLDPLYFNSYAW